MNFKSTLIYIYENYTDNCTRKSKKLMLNKLLIVSSIQERKMSYYVRKAAAEPTFAEINMITLLHRGKKIAVHIMSSRTSYIKLPFNPFDKIYWNSRCDDKGFYMLHELIEKDDGILESYFSTLLERNMIERIDQSVLRDTVVSFSNSTHSYNAALTQFNPFVMDETEYRMEFTYSKNPRVKMFRNSNLMRYNNSLHKAVRKGAVHTVSMLLAMGVDINTRNEQGENALYAAISYNCERCFLHNRFCKDSCDSTRKMYKMVRHLVDNGIDTTQCCLTDETQPNTIQIKRSTALDIALLFDRRKITNYFTHLVV